MTPLDSYQGHVPGLKFSAGDTYGGATCKSLQDTRLATLSNSKTTFANGGSFPSFYTHKPELVLDARTRSRDRFLQHPHYTLYNTDRDRLREIKTFDGVCDHHSLSKIINHIKITWEKHKTSTFLPGDFDWKYSTYYGFFIILNF